MMIYEKAIENYAKETRERYEQWREENIAKYVQEIESMTATGKCPGVACEHCPARIAYKLYPAEVKKCPAASHDEIKQYLALEYKEELQ